MKAIVMMFDTLRKDNLSPYGGIDTLTPNFQRLAEKTVKFDNFYVGSMPCMPARREMHTGRYNFLHRGWGPLEPFDDSMPELLKKHDIYTHLVTDHKHYWRDGGATYHTRYSSFELIRGQEGDSWKGRVNKPLIATDVDKIASEEGRRRKILSKSQDKVNRSYMTCEENHHCARTVGAGLEFMQDNLDADEWLLQIECFDPHEPFFVPDTYLKMYGIEEEFDGWVTYASDGYSEKKNDTIRKYYSALITMCDTYLGKVLDFMDEHDMWNDTMLIVNTDHGFLLGEHKWWGKNIMPVYNEIANIPFFIWDPVSGIKGKTRHALSQTIDIPATILDFFQIPIPKDMQGISLRKTLIDDSKVRDAALYGYFGSNINITDGHFTYMRAPKTNSRDDLYEYTLMPTRINRRFTPDELGDMKLTQPLSFTKNCQVLKIKAKDIFAENYQRFGSKLFDCQSDSRQKEPITNAEAEFNMIGMMMKLMEKSEAPPELYPYYGLDSILTVEDVTCEQKEKDQHTAVYCGNLRFENSSVKEGYLSIAAILTLKKKEDLDRYLDANSTDDDGITSNLLLAGAASCTAAADLDLLVYNARMAMRQD